jgi:integrase
MAERIKLYKLYKRGNTWWAYFSIPTPQGHNRFRCSTFSCDKKQAELYCNQRLIEEQTLPRPSQKLTIDEAFGIFYDANEHNYSKPQEVYKKLKQIKTDLNIIYLDELTPAVLNRYILNRQKLVKNATINKDIAYISSALNKLDLLGYDIPKIKLGKFKLKTPDEHVKYLDSWETAQKIIDNAQDHLKPIIYTALYTGFRRGNLLNLKWENLDFKNNTINIKVKDKNRDGGKNLSIPMIDKLKEVLQAIPRESEYVFTYKGDRIKDIKHSWHTALKNADIPYTNFHTLRHTCATWLLKKTGNIKLTQQILGHADIKTTTKYAHVLDDEKRIALEKVFE